MVHVPSDRGISGSALIRLLTRLGQGPAPASELPLSDRLSQWLGWTDAIALSAVLGGNSPAVPLGTKTFGEPEERDCARTRADLAKAIIEDSAFAPPPKPRPGQPRAPARPARPADADAEYAYYRQRYHFLQRTMETAIGNLRSRLRGILAAQSAGMTRLAVLDAIMDRALAARERSLLTAVPGLLEPHFERLRQAAQAEAQQAAADAGEPARAPDAAWLDVFRKDMQSVLLAELDIRLQPVEGLLAALRAC
ncbi:DUF3348 domain-containing protein [Achromobacter sp. Marseille-Q4962]|jgi:hypothetical protein|uniref:DUF3348 domain-containing protein n=1 Tax=Achromobacter sp. Marseille-Q4962 TaxID=2942202 RepID=UPI0020733841|nr:DUF3348 domain-containing protein [Achromobacter sp. Marseille-Q4962]